VGKSRVFAIFFVVGNFFVFTLMFIFHFQINTADLPFSFLQVIYKNEIKESTHPNIPHCCDLLHKPLLCHPTTFVTEPE